VLARPTKTAEFSIGNIFKSNGPCPILNYGVKIPPICLTSPSLGGLIGGNKRETPSERISPCYLRSL